LAIVIKDVVRDDGPVAVIVDVDSSIGIFGYGVVNEIVGGAAMVEKDAICVVIGNGIMVEVVATGVVEEYPVLVVGECVEADVDVGVALDKSDTISGVGGDNVVIDEMVV
jgi:hypothetical protein